jgi:hypothetical protein
VPGPLDSTESQQLFKTPLLITESAQDFAALTAALTQEIKPRGIIERIYVADIAALVWEILRLRRCKTVIVNTAFKTAVASVVRRVSSLPLWPKTEWVDDLANDWFLKPKARKEVSKLLEESHLDESAIEAEAIRSVFSDFEMLDRMLTLLESRRNKALRSIEDYQDRFARKVREVSDQVLEGNPVIQLENRSAQKSA